MRGSNGLRLLLAAGLTLLVLAALAPICKTYVPIPAPYKPGKPEGISRGGIGISYAFVAKTTDPEDEDLGYRFSWGTGDTTEYCDWVESGDTVMMNHAWANSGTYKVTVQAKNRPGAVSEWSNALVVEITDNHPPDTPAVPFGITEGLAGTSYEFKSAATDPDGDRVAIRFAWGDGDTSSWSGSVGSGETAAVSRAWMNPGEYKVTAQARDEQDELSGWSDSLLVTITSVPSDTVKWRFRVEGNNQVNTSPARGPEGTIYIGVGDLYAIYSVGTLKWRYPTDGFVNSSPSVGDDGTVYFGSDDLHAYAVNPDGSLKWRYRIGAHVRSSPAIGADGTVYVNAWGLWALNADGSFKWRQNFGSEKSSPAVGADGTVYAGSGDGKLYAVNPDGTLKWSYQTGGAVNSSPAIGEDGTVYVGSAGDFLCALNPDGSLKWRYQVGRDVSSSPAVGPDGTIYFGSDDNCLYALNPDSTLRWRYETGNWIASSPAIAADGTVYFGSRDNFLYALDSTGALEWRYEIGAVGYSSPLVDWDGTVVIGSGDYHLYALRGDSPLAVGAPWPKFKCNNANSGRRGGW